MPGGSLLDGQMECDSIVDGSKYCRRAVSCAVLISPKVSEASLSKRWLPIQKAKSSVNVYVIIFKKLCIVANQPPPVRNKGKGKQWLIRP